MLVAPSRRCRLIAVLPREAMNWAPLPMRVVDRSLRRRRRRAPSAGKADIPCGGEYLQGPCLDAQDFLDQQVDGFGESVADAAGPTTHRRHSVTETEIDRGAGQSCPPLAPA